MPNNTAINRAVSQLRAVELRKSGFAVLDERSAAAVLDALRMLSDLSGTHGASKIETKLMEAARMCAEIDPEALDKS